MREDFTEAVTRALELGEAWARSLGQQAVFPVHLFQALIQEEQGRVWSLLAQAGLEPGRVRQPAPGISEPADATGALLPLHESTERALSSARDLAHACALERTVASEHLLFALLQADEPLRQSLEAEGLVFPRLEAAVLADRKPPLALDEPLELADYADQIEVARLLDACGNRAREALRVVEDYCRFVLDDAFLTRALKQLRHEVTDILSTLPKQRLLEARETRYDVGTTISTPQEEERGSLSAVAQANWKRLQEALRSLEEHGKLYDPELGRKFELLRYRSYTLERAVMLTGVASARLQDAPLYVILTGSRCRHTLEKTIREAAAGGASIFQLREKGLADAALLERAREVRRVTREVGALFIMNDRPDLARLADADGVHVGQDELSVRDARRIAGPDAIIGVSTHNLDQVRQAVLDGASYIGVGPTFPSTTKTFADFPGLEFVRLATAATALPAFVIGGVTLDNLDAAIAAGAKRVAVSHAICAADDPRTVAVDIRRRLSQ